MNTHPIVAELILKSFYEQLEAFLKLHPVSVDGLLFEKCVEREAHDKLAAMSWLGWDFETASLFFGDRGTSILIQNVDLDWQMMLAWLCDLRGTMPPGSIINLEVYDSIQGSSMIGNKLIGCWFFTSEHVCMHR